MLPLNREIKFDFDFDSIVRAGEAKLRRRETSGPYRWGPECKVFLRLILLLLLLLLLQGLL